VKQADPDFSATVDKDEVLKALSGFQVARHVLNGRRQVHRFPG
jgi:hypothetical protein